MNTVANKNIDTNLNVNEVHTYFNLFSTFTSSTTYFK